MTAIECQRHIQAPIDHVFAVFTDLDHAAERLTGVIRIERLNPGPVGPGTRWRETRVMFGREAVEEMWIEEFDAPHRYTAGAESHGARYLTEFTFQPVAGSAEPATVVTMRFSAQPLGPVARILGAVLGPLTAGSLRRAVEQDMDDLRRACERAGAPA